MSQVSFSREQYAKKTAAFNELRSGATALRNVKKRQAGLTTWKPATNEGTGNQREKQHLLGRDIGGVANYFDNKRSSALDVICNDVFRLHYQIYGDVAREAVFGQNTISVFHEVVWELCDVTVGLYPMRLDSTLPREKLTAAAREGIPDRDQVAKCTGWNRNDVRNLNDDDMSMFKQLIDNVKVGQSKLTRLVKGFLILLEAMERGHVDVDLDIREHMTYGPVNVIQSFGMNGRAYVYNSRPSSEAHSAVLWRMCGAYPPPELAGSHVTVPADAKEVYMVTEGTLVGNNNNSRVRLTPGMIYASLTTYAMDVSCTKDLQQALIIACSLQQTRYFSNVKLPKVASLFDLMVPAFVQSNTRLDKPILSPTMAKSIGRLQQMLLFVNVRDVLAAAEHSTKPGFDPTQSMRAYLSSQAVLINQMAGEMSAFNLIEATLKMKVHDQLRYQDFGDLSNISILEGLWLCQEASKCVDNGIVSALVQGISDLGESRGTFDMLCQELDLAGISYKKDEIPHGMFSIGWVATCKPMRVREAVNRKRTFRAVKLVQECEFTPKTDFRSQRKKRRPVKGQAASVPTSIPVKRILRKPSPKKSEVVVESPPSYRTRSSTESSKPLSEADVQALEEAGVDIPDSKRRLSSGLRQQSFAHIIANVLGSSESKKASRSEVMKVIVDDAGQITYEEQLELHAKEIMTSNLSGKELSSLINVLMKSDNAEVFLGASTWSDFMDRIRTGQRVTNYEFDGMAGGSKFAKELNTLIDLGRPRDSMGSALLTMKTEKKRWAGDVEKAPKEGLKHICNSQAWLNYLQEAGVLPEATGIYGKEDRTGERSNGLRMATVIADFISQGPEELTVASVYTIYLWLNDSVENWLPVNVTDADLVYAGRPEFLNYRERPSSFGKRRFEEDDSKWLVLASRIPRALFKEQLMKDLCSAFDVPVNMRMNLKKTYGLFGGKNTN